MFLKYITFICLLGVIKSEKIKTPAVYEAMEQANYSLANSGVRIPRHPNTYQRTRPPTFDYKSIVQQDPQKIRYAQQQEVDSYMRAYRQQQQSKRFAKVRKLFKPIETSKKSETTPTSKENNNNHLVDIIITDEQEERKVVDLKTNQEPTNKFSSEDNSHKSDSDQQNKEKVVKKQANIGYEVSENVFDQEAEPSVQREARIYTGDEDTLKNIQYPASLPPELLTKPTYILADPQFANSQLLKQSFDYALTNSQNLRYTLPEGFQPASKDDLEALNALLGKTPGAQLQGLNELLAQQNEKEIPSLPVSQPLIQVSSRDHTPIKEDIVDVENPHTKPNIKINVNSIPQSPLPPANYVQHVQVSEKNKNVHEEQHDNLQYAAQYAFGYKIRDVHSGNDYGHEEIRDGDVAKGHYHVLLPDGRLQQVEYWVDPTGYHAKVTYSSVGQH